MNYNSEIIKDRIKQALEKNNISHSKLADKLGVGKDTVSKWVNGKAIPRTEQLLAMCNVFNCDIGYLIDSEQTAMTREAVDICKATGLSEEAVTLLKDKVYFDRKMREKYHVRNDGGLTIELALISEFIIKCRPILTDIFKILTTKQKIQEIENDAHYELFQTVYRTAHDVADFAGLFPGAVENFFYESLEKELAKDINIKKHEEDVDAFLETGLAGLFDKKELKEMLMQPDQIMLHEISPYYDVYHCLKQCEEDPNFKAKMFTISDTFLDFVKEFIKREEEKTR